MNLPKPEIILFDWDETLVESWDVILSSLNYTLEHYGLKPWTLEESHRKIRRSMRDSFPAIFGDEWEKAGKIYKDRVAETHLSHLKTKPGARELLTLLENNNIITGVISNKAGHLLRKEITHLGWDNYFIDFICGAEEAEYDKPHPAPMHSLLQKLERVCSGAVWYVGDKRTDMEFAHNTGATAVFIHPEPPDSHDLADLVVDAHVRDCFDLARLIEKVLDQNTSPFTGEVEERKRRG